MTADADAELAASPADDGSDLHSALRELTPASVRSGLLSMRTVLPTSPEQVWELLVAPDRLMEWSPVVPDRRLDSIGPASSQEQPGAPRVDASVTEVDAPRRLVHNWGPDQLIWQLAPDADHTQLQLVHVLSEPTSYLDMAAGWHLCLTVLRLRLSGVDAPRIVGADALTAGWQDVRDRYAETLIPNNADN